MARYLKMDVAGLSLIANQAAGLTETGLSHSEVLALAETSRSQARVVVDRLISIWKMTDPH
jgi:purine nucleoside phosphorylase